MHGAFFALALLHGTFHCPHGQGVHCGIEKFVRLASTKNALCIQCGESKENFDVIN